MTIEARYAASACGSIRIENQPIHSAVIWRSFALTETAGYFSDIHFLLHFFVLFATQAST
jgi:hypothetical protein